MENKTVEMVVKDLLLADNRKKKINTSNLGPILPRFRDIAGFLVPVENDRTPIPPEF